MRTGKDVDDGIPPNHQRCVRTDGRRWRCKEWRFLGDIYCEKHYNSIRLKKQKMKQIKEPAHFSERQQVEVEDEDEGFKDSWYTANILKLPNVASNTLKMVVQYDKLMASEKRKELLKESVDPCRVRPVPPPQPPNQSFQLHQSVDAFYNDGWWKGEVFEILENGRYIVHFPAWNEFTEFGADELRLHLDWVDGRWLIPLINKEDYQRKRDIAQESIKKKKQTNQWLRTPNMRLQKEMGEGSSSPTTAPERAMSTGTRTRSMKAKEALHQETGGRFSVQAKNLGDPKSDVNSSLSDGAHGALCKAQSLFLQKCSNSQSREHNKESLGGDVINQQKGGVANETVTISETGGYDIFRFESTLEDPQEETPAREGAHVIQLEFPPEGTQIKTLSNIDDVPHSVSAFSLSGSPQSRDVDATASENRKRKTKRNKGKPSKKPYKEATGGSSRNLNRTMSDITTTELESFTILKGQEALPQHKKGTSEDSCDICLTPSERFSDHPTPNSRNLQLFADSRLSDGAQGNEINQQEGRVETTRRSEATLLESAEDFIDKTPCREVVVAMGTECPQKGSEVETLSNIEDVPLSVWPTESFPPATAGDLPFNQVVSQTNMAISWVETSLNREVISDDGKLLFKKTYPVWQIFETSEIFRSMPQAPHYKPLAELHERLREGQAVGYMLSYAALVENTSKAQLDDSDSSILEKLEALEELEAVGFDVTAIRDRLEKLQRIKSVVVELSAKVKQVETKIIKEKLEHESQGSVVEKVAEKISEIQESILEMKKRRLMLVLDKMVKDSNISKFKKSLQKVEEKKHQVHLQFNRVAAAPW